MNRTREVVAVTLAATLLCGCYVALMQHGAIGDGSRHLIDVRPGQPIGLGRVHFLFRPTLMLWCRTIEPLGLPHFVNATLLCAASTTGGVVAIHVASRWLGATLGGAALTAALVGTCPAVVLYATGLEVHGVFFGAFGLTVLATAHWVRRPTAARAVIYGLSTALAYCFHNTAALLPVISIGVLVATTIEKGERPWRSLIPQILLAGVVHAAAIWAAPHVLTALLPGQADSSTAFALLTDSLRMVLTRPEAAFGIALDELVIGLVPLSLAWLAAWARRPLRPLAIAVSLATMVYVAVCVVVLGGFFDSHVLVERGAYLLPLTWPFAWLTVRALPRPWCWALLVVGAGVAVAQLASIDKRAPIQAYAAGVREAADGHAPFLLVAGEWEREVAAFELTEAELGYVTDYVLLDPATQTVLLPALRQLLAARLAAGQRVFLTAEATALLATDQLAALPTTAPFLEFIQREFVRQPVDAGEFAATELSIKP